MLLEKFSSFRLEAGADEAGRGCLAGPVTAAAVIIFSKLEEKNKEESLQLFYELLDDSKKLSAKTRLEFRSIIEEKVLSFAVTHLDALLIDKINILAASMKAMQESILKLNPSPEYVIIDGNSPLILKKGLENKNGKIFTEVEMKKLHAIPSSSIVGGDGKYFSIAAASILAKTYRDDYMNGIHEEFPVYNWKQNKGYPTKEHREAIRKYGLSKYHRRSFCVLLNQLKLDLG